MSVANSQHLPIALVLTIIVALAALFFALLSSRPERRTWFTVLMSGSFALLSGGLFALSFFSLLPWRVEVVAFLFADLVSITLTSWICLAQAGRLPRRRGQRPEPLQEVVLRSRVRALLAAAPFVMVGCWAAYSTMLMIWPVPAIEVHEPAPARFLLACFISSAPQAFYCALTGWLYFRDASNRAVARGLRLKNLSFSAGAFSWLVLALVGIAQAYVRVTFPDGAREPTIDVLGNSQNLFTLTSVLAFGLGLLIRYVPRASEWVVRTIYPALLKFQDLLDTSRWQRVTEGKEKRLVAASHYASDASSRMLGLADEDLQRCLTTLYIAAFLADRPDRTRGTHAAITPEMARNLHRLQSRILRQGDLATDLKWPKDFGATPGASGHETAAPLSDAVEAALVLTTAPSAPADGRRFADELWYGVALAAARDLGLAPSQPDRTARPLSLAHSRAIRAYRAAKDDAYSQPAEWAPTSTSRPPT